jgi:beta-lactamase superfamily II metal-dependent hydrolase
MVPHHGSRTSSHLSFVKKTSPQYAIFSYGRNNYGIPHQEVIDRYELIGSQVLTTEDYGEIIISVSSKGEITVNSFYNRTKQNKSIMINSIGFSLLIFFMLKFQERRNENE